ncbi:MULTISPECIES: hypothetical protein [unclassified Mesorhizobium]|uniref:hypothetical protein n=1 Tax=unclassified Mesorhizobium TaxID=325217 RepID=UPI0019D4BF86|nr:MULTISPECIES: hypothetical protein [unclassified Mesorhizobium]
MYGMAIQGARRTVADPDRQCLAYIAMGRTDTVPLDRIAWQTVPMHTGKPWFLPVVGAYNRMKDMVAGSCRGPRTAAE